jgi:hypothetical protein
MTRCSGWTALPTAPSVGKSSSRCDFTTRSTILGAAPARDDAYERRCACNIAMCRGPRS